MNQHQELDFLFVSKCLYVSLIYPDFIEIDPEKGEGTKVLVARHQNSGAPNVPDWSSFRLWWRSLLLDLVWKDHGWGSSLGAGGLTAGEESDLTKCQSRGKELSSWWGAVRWTWRKGKKSHVPCFHYISTSFTKTNILQLIKVINYPLFLWKTCFGTSHILRDNYLVMRTTTNITALQKIWKCWNCVLLCSSRGNNCGDNLYSIYLLFRKFK